VNKLKILELTNFLEVLLCQEREMFRHSLVTIKIKGIKREEENKKVNHINLLRKMKMKAAQIAPLNNMKK